MITMVDWQHIDWKKMIATEIARTCVLQKLRGDEVVGVTRRDVYEMVRRHLPPGYMMGANGVTNLLDFLCGEGILALHRARAPASTERDHRVIYSVYQYV